jgi:hypothetical protein
MIKSLNVAIIKKMSTAIAGYYQPREVGSIIMEKELKTKRWITNL